jgi:hypothetical protein
MSRAAPPLNNHPPRIEDRSRMTTAAGRRARVLLCLLVACAGCIARPVRGYPLYAANARPDADQVSLLAGYVARVDGRDVTSLGGAFELLPGCHLVETPVKWSKGTPTYGVLVATTGPLTFALRMTAGNRYEVKVAAGMPTGPTGTAFVRAEEKRRREATHRACHRSRVARARSRTCHLCQRPGYEYLST